MAEKETKKTTKKANTNTTKTMQEGGKVTAAQLDAEIKKAAKILGEQEKVEVDIPAYLVKRLGKTVPVGINGAVVHVPVGEKVKIPKAMAEVLNNSINSLKL